MTAGSEERPVVTSLASEGDCLDGGMPLLWAREGAISEPPFVSALGVWVACQRQKVTVHDAASAFNSTTDVIRTAANEHLWLDLAGDEIAMDGI